MVIDIMYLDIEMTEPEKSEKPLFARTNPNLMQKPAVSDLRRALERPARNSSMKTAGRASLCEGQRVQTKEVTMIQVVSAVRTLP